MTRLSCAQADEKDHSTTLLLTPDFCRDNPGGFDAFSDTLNEALSMLGVEENLQLVFFHPQYTFRDGKARMGEQATAAANYARRSPWPMINLLRTPQVRSAQKGIPTGSVYSVNEENLESVGEEALRQMLRARDWGQVYKREDYVEHSGREG